MHNMTFTVTTIAAVLSAHVGASQILAKLVL
jgi:hypothetical protein